MCNDTCSASCGCAAGQAETNTTPLVGQLASIGQEQMTDEWLVEQAGRAAWIAAVGFESEAQQAAFLRGIANRVLMAFGSDPAAALAVPFSGRVRAQTTGQEVKPC
ncbi:hypothetical protein CKO44_07715 [Rubrivivax gelatinosus]|uniref:hypothetical protein n=1 Tax=Rubrivivax gelatinosus TaxID=28068 RepID=UPI0019036D25|nr:hypothetical protein [Rubrivivax gelatinosus]MBK1613356.1 hypothetical protein [Rubrivivax gelatinosus]MBZ8143395.1 hypothetical protein [Rubrivivax gelatinosus]